MSLWFNAYPRFHRLRGVNWKPFNLFVRQGTGNWGIGLLQVRGRHLLYVGRTDGVTKAWVAFRCVWAASD